MSRLQGGRLTDRHKNKINSKEFMERLNKVAKEKVNEQRKSLCNNKRRWC